MKLNVSVVVLSGFPNCQIKCSHCCLFPGAQGGAGLVQPLLQSHVHQQLQGVRSARGHAARRLPAGGGEAHRLRLHRPHHGGGEVRAAPPPGGHEVRQTPAAWSCSCCSVGPFQPRFFFPLGKVPVRGRGHGVLRLPHEAPRARQRRRHRPLRRGDRLHGAQPALPGVHQHSLQRGEGAGLAASGFKSTSRISELIGIDG